MYIFRSYHYHIILSRITLSYSICDMSNIMMHATRNLTALLGMTSYKGKPILDYHTYNVECYL